MSLVSPAAPTLSAADGKLPFGWERLPSPPHRDMDPIQEANYHMHAQDLQYMRKHTRVFGPWANAVEAARDNPFVALGRSLLKTGGGIIVTLMSDPTAPFTTPVAFFYSVVAYTVIFSSLSIFATFLVCFKLIGGEWILSRFSSGLSGNQLSFVNWTAEPDMFESKHVVDKAKKVLGHPLIKKEQRIHYDDDDTIVERITKSINHPRRKEFDVDVARTMLLFSAAVYERENEWVKKAADYPPWAERLLQMSEEKILTFCEKWDVSYTTITDCVSVGGAYAGAYYSRDPENPWIVVAFKGTGPDDIKEWLIDATLAQESASDYLWGTCHQGFYTTLFPSNGSHLRVLPYRRIVETIRSLAQMLQATSSDPERPVNLFVTGHSLGAGLASLFYARTLKVAPGPELLLRDCYTFGCPRVGGAEFLAGWESLLHDPANDEKAYYKVTNNWDVVARVPPGIARNRSNRLATHANSLLNYGSMGIEIVLCPNKYNAPFYTIDSYTEPGTDVQILEENSSTKITSTFEGARFWGLKRQFYHPVELINTVLSTCLPFIADHGPPSYWNSLTKMTGKPRERTYHLHEPKKALTGEHTLYPYHSRGGNISSPETMRALEDAANELAKKPLGKIASGQKQKQKPQSAEEVALPFGSSGSGGFDL